MCEPTLAFEDEPDSEEWCKFNCMKYPPNCPESKCKCFTGCRPIGNLTVIEGTDIYCLRHCFHYGATNCPKDECECYGEFDEIKVGISLENEVETKVENGDENNAKTTTTITSSGEPNQSENEVDEETSNVENEEASNVESEETLNVENEVDENILSQQNETAFDDSEWTTSQTDVVDGDGEFEATTFNNEIF